MTSVVEALGLDDILSGLSSFICRDVEEVKSELSFPDRDTPVCGLACDVRFGEGRAGGRLRSALDTLCLDQIVSLSSKVFATCSVVVKLYKFSTWPTNYTKPSSFHTSRTP